MGATLVALMMHYAALCIIKTLEQERHAIDAVLLSTFGDAELRFGVRAPNGWVLEQRSRTSWDYAPEILMPTRVFNSRHRAGRYACTAHAWVVGSRSPLSPLAVRLSSDGFL